MSCEYIIQCADAVLLCSADTDMRIGIGRIWIRGYDNFLKKPDTRIHFTISFK